MNYIFANAFKDPKVWSSNFHVNDLMRFQTFLLKMSGMCDINFNEILPKRLKYLSSILNGAIFVFFSFVHLHIAALFLLEMIQTSNLHVITNAITMFIINIFAFITLLYYKWNNNKYLRMIEFMNKHFQTRSAHGLTFMTSERSYIVAKRYTLWWTIMCVSGTLQWVFVPFFTNTRMLPIALNYPIDALVRLALFQLQIKWIFNLVFFTLQANPYYQIIFILHSVCQYLLGMIFGNASTVLASTVIIASGQFDILLCSLKNLRATAMTLNGNRLKELR